MLKIYSALIWILTSDWRLMTFQLESELPASLGTVRPLELPATLYRQGNRRMFNVVLTLGQLNQLIVKRPDPSVPMEGNRKVDASRARAFGRYIREKERWVSPAIIVRAPAGNVDFKAVKEFGDDTAWGVLSIPVHLLTDITVLDGQHRTLGIFLALDEMNSEISKLRETTSDKAVLGDGDAASMLEARLAKLVALRDRIAREHISIDLAVVDSVAAKEMFVDINNNAKGVNQDFTTYLDRREIVNVIVGELIEKHPLLVNRVEIGQAAKMSPKNPNLMGTKGLADIVRAIHVGPNGRIGARVEEELRANERGAIQRVERFLDLMVDSFDDVSAVLDERMKPADLRQRSMLGSASMWRALAATYRELQLADPAGTEPFTRSEIETYFRSLERELREIPVSRPDAFWMGTGSFRLGASAPLAAPGALTSLVNALVARAREEREVHDQIA